VGALIVIVVLFAAFWLLLVRPQRNQARRQQELIRSLEVGDEIVSAGGLYGTIKRIDDDDLIVEVAPQIEVRMARGAVAGIVEPDVETAEPS
jgi:preprotein translocase subunit YajC